MRRFCAVVAAASLLATALAWGGVAPAAAGEIVVYSSREAPLIEPLLRVFEGLSGHRVKLVYAGPDLVTKLKEEGTSSTADLLIASEFSQLVRAKEYGFTEPSNSAPLRDRIPDVYRDSDGHWFGLTRRARIFVVAAKRIPKHLAEPRYEDLAGAALRGRVCARSGLHPYNVALVASMIAHEGPEEASEWLRGFKRNLARKPTGGDRDQILAVINGQCDVAVVNSYYVAALQKSTQPEVKAAAAELRVLLPNAADRGTHVTISGMAVAKGVRNLVETELLMDFLTSRPAQKIFAIDNEEYPVREDEGPSALVAGWGALEAENMPLGHLSLMFPEAVEMIRKNRFDDGPGE